ncbi:unnamed protein product [Linum trigynum]|uniref:Uncharacterized protein n=1 Tax=Linum trigynum TaxID=586398 RepID=A0AAV2FA73_9ROSI
MGLVQEKGNLQLHVMWISPYLAGSRHISSLQARFVIQAGLRGCFQPKFQVHYSGKAIGGRMVTMKVKDLVGEESLGHVATEVNRVVVETTDEKLKEVVENLISLWIREGWQSLRKEG